MTLIHKIKTKIERLKSLCEDHLFYLDNCEQCTGYVAALDDIEEYLNSLEEEPQVKASPYQKDIASYITDFDSCFQEGDKITTNKDGTRFNVSQLERVAVSEDLEKAAIRIADEILPIAGREIWHGETEKNIERRKQIREGVKRGANWQRDQMMKDAVDAEVGYWNIRGLSLNVRLKGDIEDGDRVKLIMIKEE